MAEPARIVLYRDRVAVIGPTESGKSEIARHLFESARCRKWLIDSKHSWRVEGVKPVRDVADVDWKAPVVHVQPPWQDRDAAHRLYNEIFRRLRHGLVWTDEATGVSNSAWHGAAIVSVQTQGRELEIGHVACMQRPVDVDRELTTEAQHVFLVPPIDDDDLKLARRGFGFISLEELRSMLNELPYHGFLWLDRRMKRVTVGDPLPEELRRPRLVFRRSGG